MSLSYSLEDNYSLLPLEDSFVPNELGSLSRHGRVQGYDEEFDPPLDSKYKCTICHLGLRDPVQTFCGHRFCKECFLHSIRDGDGDSLCPLDKKTLSESQFYPDKFVEREVLEFEVLCRAKKQSGCPWKGPLSMLEDHLSRCQLVVVNCEHNCGKQLQRKDIHQHMEAECLHRKTPCEHCEDPVLWSEFEKHFENCSKYPQQCEKCKEEGIKRDKMKLHLEQQCPNVKIECPFNLVGCAFEGLRCDAEKHLVNDHICEIMDLIKIAVSYQIEVIRKGLNQTEVKSKSENEAIIDKQGKQIQELEHEVGCLKQTLTNKVNWLEFQLNKMHNLMLKQEIKLLQQEGHLCNGVYIWKIESLFKCYQDAISGTNTVMYSPGFYTNPYGYKLCLRINLNGVENGDGSHVALFVHVMRGDYDEHLEWPFPKSFKLSIMDQSDGVESKHHITKRVAAEPERNAFQRPVAPFNVIGFGYPDFAPTDIINKPQYTKNNTLLVKFKVTG